MSERLQYRPMASRDFAQLCPAAKFGSSSMSDQQPERPQRRWFQFSLRTLLIVVAVVAAVAAAWHHALKPYWLQREAMAAIAKLGGTYKTENAKGWLGWVGYLDDRTQCVV